ncbi:MAG TPA: LPS export ABC transporter periplasmic protein LptC [Bdellovibrionota bacterium]|jgi:LPS export ABC transporter protein LptC|nr:LPS export ABC transporter periplasmic protein LptC [Bdellovibrionota bacterium]
MAQALMVLPSQTPDIEIKTFELLETENNWRSLEIKSPHAEIYKKRDMVGIHAPQATVWNKAGNATLLKGDAGIIDSKSGNVQVNGNTQIEAQNGMIFNTDVIVFANQQKQITTDAPVVGKSRATGNQKPSLEINGTGLNVDIKTQSYSVLSDVRARQTHNQDFFSITSHTASFFPVTNKAQFAGEAQVQSKKMLLKGEIALLLMDPKSGETKVQGIEMSSNSPDSTVLANIENFVINSRGFQVKFGPNGNLQESKAIGSVNAVSPSGIKMNAQTLRLLPSSDGFIVNLEQGVRIAIDDRIATCEEAIYYPTSGNIVLRKFASVVREDQQLNGDLIRLSTKNSEVIVEKASGTLNRDAMQKKKPL